MSTSHTESTNKTEQRVPIGDGWSNDTRATASCYCGAIQIEFPLTYPENTGFTFICNCEDCRKITASMFATNFVVKQAATRFIRGEDNISNYARDDTTLSGRTMTNGFCRTCGTLMYRQSSGFMDEWVMRTGTVDDFNLHETKLKPVAEVFTDQRVAWLHGGAAEGMKQFRTIPE